MAGAALLYAVLVWYAATSEVSWLFLLASWVVALLGAAAVYSMWNRTGLSLRLALHHSRPTAGSPAEQLPEQLLRRGPYPAPVFEGDGLDLEIAIQTRGSARGPAWVVGKVAGVKVTAGTGLVPKEGWRRLKTLRDLGRGPIGATGWTIGTSDPLGFFRAFRASPDTEVALVLPRFASLAARHQARELEASVAAPRAGSGNELFGIREYRPGDSLRRIHWRSSARHGELVVREYEPPGVQTLGIFVDPAPPTTEIADQVARLAASEAWDCLSNGGRVVIWAPGFEATQSPRDLWGQLEWLARYPNVTTDVFGVTSPAVGELVIVTSSAHPALIEAVAEVMRRGARVRGWVIGDTELDVDAPIERVGTQWPI